MDIIDPGHKFKLSSLDGDHEQTLQFVKRCDPDNPGGGKYPGNHDSYPGTTSQEVIRALIARLKYVDNQVKGHENTIVLLLLRQCLYLLEARAKRRRGEVLPVISCSTTEIELEPTCPRCGHIRCTQCSN